MKKQIIGKFKEEPRTTIAWLAIGLGLVAWFGVIVSIIVQAILSQPDNEKICLIIGIIFMAFAIICDLSSVITGIIALKKGERSWLLWAVFIPAILLCCFWSLGIVDYFFNSLS
ncbi:MAG: hypothetical protein WC752_01955 [Patescibacteria group bacterium]|jgi:MFS family permease